MRSDLRVRMSFRFLTMWKKAGLRMKNKRLTMIAMLNLAEEHFAEQGLSLTGSR